MGGLLGCGVVFRFVCGAVRGGVYLPVVFVDFVILMGWLIGGLVALCCGLFQVCYFRFHALSWWVLVCTCDCCLVLVCCLLIVLILSFTRYNICCWLLGVDFMLVGCCSVYLFACLRELVFWLVIGDSRCVVCFCMGLIFGCLWWMGCGFVNSVG